MAETDGSGLDEAEYRHVLGHFATGVTVVTGTSRGELLGLTCQSFTSLSLDPPLVSVAISRASTSWPGIATSGRYCVNVLSAGQAELARNFALRGGHKFEGFGWSWSPGGNPLLDGHLAFVDCTVAAVHDVGDHVLAVGSVVALGAPSGLPEDAAGALIFYRGRFTDLVEITGLEVPDRGYGEAANAIELQE